MPEKFFADTWYWVAYLDQTDAANAAVRDLYDALVDDTIITSHMVLDEVLGTFTSDRTAYLRKKAVELIDSIREDGVIIIDQTAQQFHDAVHRYRMFEDKQWSLTDCSSMNIMQEQGIQTALTGDHHFVQAGFQILP